MFDVDTLETCLEKSDANIELITFAETPSTNLVAKEALQSTQAEYVLAIAEKQTQGEGRRGRQWESPVGGLYMSIGFYPELDSDQIPVLGLLAGCGTAHALIKMTELPVTLKWPNDLLINNRKVGGILSELVAEEKNAVIIGIGINLDVDISRFSDEVQKSATSVSKETTLAFSRENMICTIFESILLRTRLFEHTGDSSPILTEWRELNSTIGSFVEISDTSGVWNGWATGIDSTGSLIVQRETGEVIAVSIGDVVHLR